MRISVSESVNIFLVSREVFEWKGQALGFFNLSLDAVAVLPAFKAIDAQDGGVAEHLEVLREPEAIVVAEVVGDERSDADAVGNGAEYGETDFHQPGGEPRSVAGPSTTKDSILCPVRSSEIEEHSVS